MVDNVGSIVYNTYILTDRNKKRRRNKMNAKDAKQFQVNGEQAVYITAHVIENYFSNEFYVVTDLFDTATKTEVMRIRESAIDFEVQKGKKVVSVEAGRLSLVTVTFEVEKPATYRVKTKREAYQKARELMKKYK